MSILEQLATAVQAGGASALSFTALGTLVLGWLANRWFSNDSVTIKIFVYLTIFLGVAGVYYTQILGFKPEAISSRGDSPTLAQPASNASANETAAVVHKQPDYIDRTPPPPPPVKTPMKLDVLAQASDAAYDRGDFKSAYGLNADGCGRGASISCRWNGYLFASGKGFPVDNAKAAAWYAKGCSLGDGVSCEQKQALEPK